MSSPENPEDKTLEQLQKEKEEKRNPKFYIVMAMVIAIWLYLKKGI